MVSLFSIDINANPSHSKSAADYVSPLHQSFNSISNPDSEKLAAFSSGNFAHLPTISICVEMLSEGFVEVLLYKTPHFLINQRVTVEKHTKEKIQAFLLTPSTRKKVA